ncbi:MAG: hypothetical protein WAM82_00400 [Thermoanaerobaculia bacterium]
MPLETERIATETWQNVPREHPVSARRILALWLAVFSIVVASVASARAQDPTDQCPADNARAQIEVLPFIHTGSTCSPFTDSVSSYDGGACRIPAVDYHGGDAIYKVWLHPGNKVAFNLHVDAPADLVLALIKECTDSGATLFCVNSSIDFISSLHDEGIPDTSYDSNAENPDSGIYYLYVDSARTNSGPDHCGSYTLTVTGVNPTPDLEVGLNSSPQLPSSEHPNAAVAGETLKYTLTVTNVGDLEATGVKVTQCLPRGVALVQTETDDQCHPTADPACQGFGSALVCSVGSLAKLNGQASRQVTVLVPPLERGVLKSKAIAAAKEGDPTPGNNQQDKETEVIAESDLSVTLTSSPSRDATAGEFLIYTLQARNEGPSTATNVVITDNLLDLLSDVDCPVDRECISAPGCEIHSGTVTCRFPKIGPRKDAPARLISFKIKSSTTHGKALVNTATVSAAESEPIPNLGPNSAMVTTNVIRKTDLSVTKTAPDVVIAGDKNGLTYTLFACNCGPSDSRNATIMDDLADLPPGVQLRKQNNCTEDKDRKVTCSTGPMVVGGCQPDNTCNPSLAKQLSFVVDVPSSLSITTLTNKANIKSVEMDPNSRNDTSGITATKVMIEADLTISKTALKLSDLTNTSSVVAGSNLLYSLEANNEGPSDSRGGTIIDNLPGVPANLSFVASPDGCGEKNRKVSCPVPPLPVGMPFTARFVVAVPSGATGSIINEASVVSEDGTSSTSKPTSTSVTSEADLAVTLSDFPDPVDVADHKVTYTLAVTNHGPSDAGSFNVKLTLPPGASLDPDSNKLCMEEEPTQMPVVVRCGFMDGLVAGKTESRSVDVLLSDKPERVCAMAAVTESSTSDPNDDNNKDEECTTITDEAILSLTKTADAAVVVAGGLLHYTLEVTNLGRAKADAVTVNDELLDTLSFVPYPESVPAEEKCCMATKQSVTCQFGDIWESNKKSCTFTAMVKPSSTNYWLTNEASFPDRDSNPNSFNSKAAATTLVLSNSLILPFFQVGSAATATTKLAVHNPSADEKAGVRFDYVAEGLVPTCQICCLQPKQTYTQDLLALFENAEGHVGITPVANCPSSCSSNSPTTCDQPLVLPDSPPSPLLSGDFIRVDSATGPASALPLVATDTSRVPPELCRSWSVRFANGGPLDTSTEFFFFVPGNRSNGKPVAIGKVYDEAGQLFQEISATDSKEAFHRLTNTDLKLLPSFGSIEWEFPDGIGYVSAIHRAGGYAVAIPGVCRKSPPAENLGPESDLILPYFEVGPGSATTLFAVRNESENEVKIRYEYFFSNGTSLHTGTSSLSAHATLTVNPRDPAQGIQDTTGYVQIGVAGGEAHQRILSGDFVRIDPTRGLASGGALVDTDLHRSPPQLCRRWNVRFLQGVPQDATTDVVFYLGTGRSVPVTGVVYREAGGNPTGPTLNVAAQQRIAFQVDGLALGLTGAGSIDWDLGEGTVGNVSTILRANGLSVLVPGVCIPGE